MEASCEAGLVRVTIDHFTMTAQEMSRLWADQDKYIDLLESRLEKGSQQEKRMMLGETEGLKEKSHQDNQEKTPLFHLEQRLVNYQSKMMSSTKEIAII